MKLLKFLSLSLVIGVTMISTTNNALASEKAIEILVDGKVVVSDVPPQIIDNRTMVPVRAIYEAVGASVTWDDETKLITGVKDEKTSIMQLGKKDLLVNGLKTEMDCSPVIINGRTLAPARYVAESLGYEVKWDAESKRVLITTPELNDDDAKPEKKIEQEDKTDSKNTEDNTDVVNKEVKEEPKKISYNKNSQILSKHFSSGQLWNETQINSFEITNIEVLDEKYNKDKIKVSYKLNANVIISSESNLNYVDRDYINFYVVCYNEKGTELDYNNIFHKIVGKNKNYEGYMYLPKDTASIKFVADR